MRCRRALITRKSSPRAASQAATTRWAHQPPFGVPRELSAALPALQRHGHRERIAGRALASRSGFARFDNDEAGPMRRDGPGWRPVRAASCSGSRWSALSCAANCGTRTAGNAVPAGAKHRVRASDGCLGSSTRSSVQSGAWTPSGNVLLDRSGPGSRVCSRRPPLRGPLGCGTSRGGGLLLVRGQRRLAPRSGSSGLRRPPPVLRRLPYPPDLSRHPPGGSHRGRAPHQSVPAVLARRRSTSSSCMSPPS